MYLTQVGSVAATVEAARVSGVQQASQSASASAVQKQNSKAAQEVDLRRTEVVEEPGDRPGTEGASERRLDITV